MRKDRREVKRRRKERRSRPPGVGDRLAYAGLLTVVAALRVLPVETGAAAMGFVWRTFGPLTARHKRAQENLRLALPQLGEREHRRILRDQWDNLGRTAAESLQIERLVADPSRLTLAISPELDEKLRCPGGQVHVSLHSGNWEVCAYPVRRYRAPAGLYQRLTNALIDAFVVDQRRRIFAGGLYPKARDSTGRIIEWVRGGEAIGMLVDHREARGIKTTMFGLPALANPFPAMVARKLGVPLVAGRAVRLPGSRFRIDATEIAVPVTHSVRDDILTATQAIQSRFEAWIRERPGEWMWIQDRFRESRAAPVGAKNAPAACQTDAERQRSSP